MVNQNRSCGIILLGQPENYRLKLAVYLGETVKFPVLDRSFGSEWAEIFKHPASHYVLNGLSEQKTSIKVITQWINQHRRQIDVVVLGGDKQERLEQELVKKLKSERVRIHLINSKGSLKEVAKRLFLTLSPYIFWEGGMVEGYDKLRTVCHPEEGEHIFISGMPTFVYGGRVLMKDFDILVPDQKLDFIAKTIGTPVRIKDSSVAYTRSSYVGNSVEVVSNLVVYADGQKIPFPFKFLWEEVRLVRFMGVSVPIMGLEDLILFKTALGRVGTDDFGRHKDDLADVEGLIGRCDIDWKKLSKRAGRLRMEERLRKKLAAININIQ